MQASKIHEAIAWAVSEIDSDTARLDAEVLLARVLGQPRSYLYTWPDKTLDDSQMNEFGFLVLGRAQGKPVAYLVGEQEFWSLQLKVSHEVLVPRPETEDMVRFILENFDHAPRNLIDIGTGSGAIALALATERPGWNIIASDISPQAIAIARQNAATYCSSVDCVVSDLFENVTESNLDIVVSNPPYVAASDQHLEALRYEPGQALVAGDDGMQVIKRLLPQAFNALVSGGYCFVEHGFDQATMVKDLFGKAGFINIHCEKDMAGLDRFSYGVKP